MLSFSSQLAFPFCTMIFAFSAGVFSSRKSFNGSLALSVSFKPATFFPPK